MSLACVGSETGSIPLAFPRSASAAFCLVFLAFIMASSVFKALLFVAFLHGSSSAARPHPFSVASRRIDSFSLHA
jgi:hypothetical protein